MIDSFDAAESDYALRIQKYLLADRINVGIDSRGFTPEDARKANRDVAGTQAAGDALFRGNPLAPVFKAAACPNAELRPFEVLLQSTSIESNAESAHVIAFRVE